MGRHLNTRAGVVAGVCALVGLAASPSRSETFFDVNFSSPLPAGWTLHNGAEFGSFITGYPALGLDFGNDLDSYLQTAPIHVVAGATYTISWNAGAFYTVDPNGPEGFVRRLSVNGTSIASEPYFSPPAVLWMGEPTFAPLVYQTFQYVPNTSTITLTFGDVTAYPYNLGGASVVGFVELTGPAPGGVPEPASWAMMLIGAAGLGAMLRRRRREAFAG